MKKILIVLLGILILPLQTNAVAVSETFKIGDRVKVLVSEASEPVGHEFFVIKPSAANDPYVWLFLNENVENEIGNTITVFDEIIQGEKEDLTDWKKSMAYELLHQATESWRPRIENYEDNIRLLNAQDIVDLGLEKNPVTGEYQILANRSRIAPIKLTGGYPGMTNPDSAINYWTQIYDTEAEETSVFAVVLNKEYNENDQLSPLAFIRSHEITSITDNVEFVLRPVIKIHKMYIDCFVDETPAPPVVSPPTSEVNLPFEVVAVVGVAAVFYILVRKKEIFNKI